MEIIRNTFKFKPLAECMDHQDSNKREADCAKAQILYAGRRLYAAQQYTYESKKAGARASDALNFDHKEFYENPGEEFEKANQEYIKKSELFEKLFNKTCHKEYSPQMLKGSYPRSDIKTNKQYLNYNTFNI